MSLKIWELGVSPFVVDHYALSVELEKVAVCAKWKLVKLCLCNGLVDFSLLESGNVPDLNGELINLTYPTVASFLWTPYALLDPAVLERDDL